MLFRSKTNVGAIVGGIIAALVVIAVGAVVAVYFLKKGKKAEVGAEKGKSAGASKPRSNANASKPRGNANASKNKNNDKRK